MKVENVQVPIATTKNELHANYSIEDIERLILNDLENHGYNSKKAVIRYHTSYKYEDDSLGMNRHLATSFDGATVNITDA